jgi:hypothetical protein
MLNAVKLIVVMLSVVKLSANKLTVVILSVVAPCTSTPINFTIRVLYHNFNQNILGYIANPPPQGLGIQYLRLKIGLIGRYKWHPVALLATQ